MLRSLLIVLLAILPFISFGQDFRFSQYFHAPQMLNPGLTGAFNGDLRFAANYRNQWGALESFTTYATAIDAGIGKRKMNGDYVGVGAVFISDIAGTDLDYVSTSAFVSGAYHKQLRKQPAQFLSLGFQAGMVQRQLDLGNPLFRPLWDPGVNNDPILASSIYNTSFIDFNAGLLWYGQLGPKFSAYGGFGFFHLNNPSQSLTGIDNDKLLMKMLVHGGLEYKMSYEVSILMTTLTMFQGGSQETNAGAYLKYTLDETNNVAIYGGGWYRIVTNGASGIDSDALVAGFKLDVKYFTLGLSYDLTISGLTSYNNLRGGPEIALIFISPFDGRKNENVRYCPRF